VSIEAFSREISRFLEGQGPEVLCITGQWGVGKTFAWNKFLGEAKTNKKIGLKTYAYVSLFGQNSLEDVRQALFENSLGIDQSQAPADLDTFKSSVDRLVGKWRSAAGLLKYVPKISDYAAIAGKLGFLSIKDQIICFDDLERAGSGLTMKDVLGLVSFLKEQRKCRIVLLLNEEQLADQQGVEFRSQLEKVADTVMKFEPTPAEAAEIGIDKSTPFHAELAEFCRTLSIVNIRTIKKIEKFCARIYEEISSHDPRVLKQAVHSATLFGYAKFQPDNAPPLSYLRSFDPYAAVPEGEEAHAPQQLWRDLLRSYQFVTFDELDAVVLTGIERGHFDSVALEAAATALDRQKQLEDRDTSFSLAWDAYHGSFDDNAEAVLDGLENAIRTSSAVITPGNLSSTIAMLKEQGREDRTAALIDHYVGAREEGVGFWNLDDDTFGTRVTDPDVRAAFTQKLASFPDDRDVAELLISIAMDRGWNERDVTFLARQSTETYREIFKRLRNPQLRRAVAGGLAFRNIRNPDADMQIVTDRVTAALQAIAAESRLNRARVAEKGVQTDHL